MTQFSDMMIDVETGGLDPSRNPIIQIAAVKFNYDTGAVGGMFDRCLGPAYGRLWDESTRDWWSTMPETYQSICDRAEDPALVMKDFNEFVDHGYYRFWAKPTSFDFPFVQSYFAQFGYGNPFHFRMARDLNSFMAGLTGKPEHPQLIPFEFAGTPHNAIDDVIDQITQLFHAKAGMFQ